MERESSVKISATVYKQLEQQPKSVLKKIIMKELKEAPKITGSEKCADVFVNVKSGSNFWTSSDCNRCPFGETAEWSKEKGYECEA